MRTERADQVRQLRESGLTNKEVAQRLGISVSYAHELHNDPAGEKVRARKASYAGTCRVCGAPTNGSDGREKAADRCGPCMDARNEERNHRIIEAWERGEKWRQIAAREGLTLAQIQGVIQHRREKGEAIAHHKRRHRELWPLIEKRWNEGATIRETADECEASCQNIAFMMKTMRRAGINLPYRTQRAA